MIEKDELLLEVDRSSFVRLPHSDAPGHQELGPARRPGVLEGKKAGREDDACSPTIVSVLANKAHPIQRAAGWTLGLSPGSLPNVERRGGRQPDNRIQLQHYRRVGGQILMARSVWLWDLLINFLLRFWSRFQRQSPFLFRSNLRHCLRVR